ncbi:MAG: SRPBCC family protein [Methylobacteriaceae bacterium]|nr:SRPBCC family protein [Methylobacteriaceae bacterium]
MSIAPIVQTVLVRLPTERAFEVFVGRMGDWWAKGKTIGKNPHRAIVLEPYPGGRWYEEDAAGTQCEWGRVLAWEPPHRLLLAWHLDASFTHDPGCETEVLITFTPEASGTRVTLEHRHLERFGPSAERVAAALAGGWPTRLQDFVAFTDGESTP